MKNTNILVNANNTLIGGYLAKSNKRDSARCAKIINDHSLSATAASIKLAEACSIKVAPRTIRQYRQSFCRTV